MITELVIHTFFDYHGLLAFAGVGTSNGVNMACRSSLSRACKAA